MLFDYICEIYEPGQPIFVEDIQIENMTKEDKQEQLKRLLAYHKLFQFDAETYFQPLMSLGKQRTKISPDVVVREKYITRKGKRIGYFCGHTLVNQMGISPQVPHKEELASNVIKKEIDEVKVGWRTYVVQRPPIEVTEENYRILQLLDVLKRIHEYVDETEEMIRDRLTLYIRKNNLSRAAVDQYLGCFPPEAEENMRKLRLENVFA